MKYVYLDQMHWITLAKSATGRPDGSRFTPLLRAVRNAVHQGRVVFPLSTVHIMETAKSPRLDQRFQLGQLMAELSMGTVLRSPHTMVEPALRNAVRRMFGQPPTEHQPSPFGRGVEEAFGVDIVRSLNLPPARGARLRTFFDSPVAWIDLLSHWDEATRRNGVAAVKATGEQGVRQYERRRAVWAEMSHDMMRRAYAALLTNQFWRELQDCLHEVGHSLEEWAEAGPAGLVRFWESIPTLHVEMELHLQMHRQTSRRWTPNDDMDIGALSLAVPSCDIVATEAFWVDLMRRRCLHTRYATLLISNLADLAPHLG